MLDDGLGGIWMSGNRGVVRVEASELDAASPKPIPGCFWSFLSEFSLLTPGNEL